MIHLATSPEPQTLRNMRSSVPAMFRVSSLAKAGHRDIPAPEPDPEPNPEPDGAMTLQRTDIPIADWDALFRAVTDRLEACAGSVPSAHSPEHLLGVTASLQTTVRECVVSLNQLHVDLTRERKKRQQSA